MVRLDEGGVAVIDVRTSECWIEIPRDDGLLFGFLTEALALLERPEPPGGAPLCDSCVYRDAAAARACSVSGAGGTLYIAGRAVAPSGQRFDQAVERYRR